MNKTPAQAAAVASTELKEFPDEATEVMNRLREVTATLLASVKGGRVGEIGSASDLQRVLGINSKLSWQIHKVATSSDPLAVASHVPKPAAMRRFLDAASQRGGEDREIRAVRDAAAAFDSFVKRTAGDRTVFDSMVGSIAGGDAAAQIDIQHRRAAFRAQSHIFGLQMRIMVSCNMIKTARDGRGLDWAYVRGPVDLRRFRQDAAWITSGRRVSKSNQPADQRVYQPLDPDAFARHRVPLIESFCTQPLPKFRLVETASGFQNIEVVGREVGNDSAVTYIAGDAVCDFACRFRTDDDTIIRCWVNVGTPTEVLYHDLLVQRGTFGENTPRLEWYGNHRTRSVEREYHESDRLPQRIELEHLGRGIDSLYTADLPNYTKIGRHAFERLGWSPDEFDHYRCRIEYPVMPSSLAMIIDLPEESEPT